VRLVELTGDAEQIHGLGPEGHGTPHLAHVDREARRLLGHAPPAGLDELHVQAMPTREFECLRCLRVPNSLPATNASQLDPRTLAAA
jgi:hypothetical protein